jgi:ADP-ribose pyrophosphatase
VKNLFFYGTLRHLPLLEIVMGNSGTALDVTADQLTGYRVSAVAEGPFPMIAPDPGASAQGILVRGLTDQEIARLDFYEGSFAYDLRKVTLDSGTQAEVYVPQPDLWTPDGPWSLHEWEQGPGAISVIAAREVMGYFGSRSREEVAGMFDMIRTRAASELRAGASLHGKDSFHGAIEVQSRKRVYANFFALDEIELRHERYDGTLSAPLERAVFIPADAALVLPYDPKRDLVLLVEQIRLGPIGRGDPTCLQSEPIAGRVDPGETPQQAAHREAKEEAGLTLERLETIVEGYPSPGTSSEFFYIYLGITELPDSITGIGGLDTEDENIRAHLVSFDDLMARVARQDVANVPLALCAYYLARHRERLRSDSTKGTPRG